MRQVSLYDSIVAPRSDLYALVESFVRPRWPQAVAELLETFIPYVVLNVVMVLMIGRGHPVVALALTVPAAAFLVRVFIIFHDCCHGSFFRSRRANRITGYVAGMLTLTPYDKWQREHAQHHATAGDLELVRERQLNPAAPVLVGNPAPAVAVLSIVDVFKAVNFGIRIGT